MTHQVFYSYWFLFWGFNLGQLAQAHHNNVEEVGTQFILIVAFFFMMRKAVYNQWNIIKVAGQHGAKKLAQRWGAYMANIYVVPCILTTATFSHYPLASVITFFVFFVLGSLVFTPIAQRSLGHH